MKKVLPALGAMALSAGSAMAQTATPLETVVTELKTDLSAATVTVATAVAAIVILTTGIRMGFNAFRNRAKI